MWGGSQGLERDGSGLKGLVRVSTSRGGSVEKFPGVVLGPGTHLGLLHSLPEGPETSKFLDKEHVGKEDLSRYRL